MATGHGCCEIVLIDPPRERWGDNEARLLRSPPPALRLFWSSPHWRLFAVRDTQPLISAGRLIKLGVDTVTVALPAARTTVVRVRYHRFWKAGPNACVTRSALGFTRIRARQAGIYTLRARLDVPALLGDRDGCHAALRKSCCTIRLRSRTPRRLPAPQQPMIGPVQHGPPAT